MNDDRELWDTVDRMRQQPNHVPQESSREELIDYIGRMQRQMDETISISVARCLREERAAHKAKVLELQKRVQYLTNRLDDLRAKQGT